MDSYLPARRRFRRADDRSFLWITYYNLGIRGETSRDLAQRWQAEVKRRTAPHHDMRIVFSFGTNDTTLETEQRDRIGTLTQEFGILCQDLQIPFLDVFTPLLNSPIWMQEVAQGDGSHPQAVGYEVLARQIQAWPDGQGWPEGRSRATPPIPESPDPHHR